MKQFLTKHLCVCVCVCVCVYMCMVQLCLILCDPTECSQLLCPPDIPGQQYSSGLQFLLQGIFLTQGKKLIRLCLLHCQADFPFYLSFFFFFFFFATTKAIWEALTKYLVVIKGDSTIP